MIKKLTIKTWIGTGGLILIMLALGVPMLWIYAPSAIEALQGGHPALARKESMSNIYGLSVLGTIFVLMALLMLIGQLKNSVKKNIRLLCWMQNLPQQRRWAIFGSADALPSAMV